MNGVPDHDERLPEALQREIESFAARATPVSPERDAAVREAIRDHFEGSPALRSARLRPWRRIGAVAAVAAAIVVLVTVIPLLRRSRPSEVAAPRLAIAGDVDGSGRVDMLDAFAIARAVDADAAPAAHDVNGDGVVDERDVEHVARLAVDLGAMREGPA